MISNNAKRLGGIVLVFVSAMAWADSGVGVDTWRANELDPTGGKASERCDEDGTSWLSPVEHRSPTGNLYDCPSEPPIVRGVSNWVYYGVLQLGYVNTGNDRFASYNRYTDWKANQGVGLIDLHFERPSDGTYAEVRGSRIDDDDQYYQAVYGQAGAYKVEAFIRDMPNILSTDAKPIWNGVGSNNLTLPPFADAGPKHARASRRPVRCHTRSDSRGDSKEGRTRSQHLPHAALDRISGCHSRTARRRSAVRWPVRGGLAGQQWWNRGYSRNSRADR